MELVSNLKVLPRRMRLYSTTQTHGAVWQGGICAYVKGPRPPDCFEKAIDCFEKAYAIDPGVRNGTCSGQELSGNSAVNVKLARNMSREQMVAAVAGDDEMQLRFRDAAEKLLGIDVVEREKRLIAAYYSDPPRTDVGSQYWISRGQWYLKTHDYPLVIESCKL